MNKSETIGKLATSLVKAQNEVKHAIKDAKNPFFKSKYADLTTIIDTVKPALNKHGITVLQIIVPEGVETVLLHESGEFVSGITPIVVAKQNDPQALGSAVTYARRYGLQAMLSIGADDDDAEGAMGRKTVTTPTRPQTSKASTPISQSDYDDMFN